MLFKQVLLASAVAAVSSQAFAMEAMDDSALSTTAGQDGITVKISTPAAGITAGVIIHDRDGWDTAGTISSTSYSATAGAFIIGSIDGSTADARKEFKLVSPAGITLDMDVQGAASPYLNIKANLGASTVISTGDLSVGKVTAMGAAPTAQTATILDSVDLSFGGGLTVNIQLGNEAQTYTFNAASKTAMMLINNTTVTGGLTITNFGLTDASSSQKISVASIALKDQNAAVGANLTLGTIGINVETTGLVVDVASLGGTNGLYAGMTNVKLGTAPAIGNVELMGLNLNGSQITIAGHD